MKASETKLLHLLGVPGTQLIVPIYQRKYSWGKKQCKKLLEDLTDIATNNATTYFFGPVVYVVQNIGGVQFEYTIIDGQQRLTTISLLLIAITHYLEDNQNLLNDEQNQINLKQINDCYLKNPFAKSIGRQIKLKLSETDQEQYQALLSRKSLINGTHIQINYDFFLDEIAEMDVSQLNALYRAIEILDVVGISLTQGDNPQLIFESLNSTGLDLTMSDKIRNYVLMSQPSEKQEYLYRTYWQEIEKFVDSNAMDFFFRCYLDVKLKRLVTDNTIYDDFKIFCQNSKRGVENILKDILENAKYFSQLINPINNDSLINLKNLDKKAAYPFLLDVFHQEALGVVSKDDKEKILKTLENYFVRKILCSRPTQGENKFFIEVIPKIGDLIEKKNISYCDALLNILLSTPRRYVQFPKDEELEENLLSFELYQTKTPFKKYFFEQLENFGQAVKFQVTQQLGDGSMSIEHIMPQTLSSVWEQALGQNFLSIHEKYLHSLGNLTLTTKNSEMGNLSFDKKKQIEFAQSKLFLNDFVKQCDEWTEEKIVERAKRLIERVKTIWDYPQINIINKPLKDDWFNWDDDFEITNKTITKVRVLGEEKSTDSVADAFVYVHKILYDLWPEVYGKEKVNFYWFGKLEELKERYPASPKSSFREIEKNIYVCTQTDSATKIKAIQDVCEKMNLNAEDVQFFIQ